MYLAFVNFCCFVPYELEHLGVGQAWYWCLCVLFERKLEFCYCLDRLIVVTMDTTESVESSSVNKLAVVSPPAPAELTIDVVRNLPNYKVGVIDSETHSPLHWILLE